MHRLLKLVADVVGLFDLDRILRDRLDHRDDLGFLKAELANAGVTLHTERCHLTGDKEARHGIEPGAADPGDHVHRTWPAGPDGAPQIASDACIGVRGHGTRLFVVRADMGNILVFRQRVQKMDSTPRRI